jgi:serine/alanine racemase
MREYTKSISETECLKKQYDCVDLLKFLCAFLVVAKHVAPLSSYSTLLNYGLQNWFASIAVPFYFIASGYFLFRKTTYDNFDETIALAYAGRIFRLYIIWTVIYFPLTLKFTILDDEKGIVHGLMVWVRNCIFTGSYNHLWYLNATVVATLILTFCLHKKIKIRTILCLSALLYGIGLLGQSYFVFLKPLRNFPTIWQFLKLVGKIIVTTRNGLFEGFFFMGIGMLFAYKPVVMKLKTAIIGFTGSMALFFTEVLCVHSFKWGLKNTSALYFFFVPSVIFMFYIATHIELNHKPIYKHLRKLGILIFYLHSFIKPFIEKGLRLLGTENSLLQYCGTVLVTIVISECVLKLSSKPRFQWLKKIYV